MTWQMKTPLCACNGFGILLVILSKSESRYVNTDVTRNVPLPFPVQIKYSTTALLQATCLIEVMPYAQLSSETPTKLSSYKIKLNMC